LPSAKPLLRTCAMVFFSSLSVLGFEVALVRLCSIRFSYHYATPIISISMVGFVVGGVVAYLRQRVRHHSLPDPLVPETVTPFLIALSLAMPLVLAVSFFVPFDQYRLLWQNSQLAYLALLACVFAAPFFVYGTMMPLLFKARPLLADRVYAADLCGAAAGALVALFLADNLSPERVIVIMSAFPWVTAGLGPRRNRLVALGLCFFLLAAYGVTAFDRFSLAMSPYKGLPQALSEEGSSLKETIHTSDSRLDLFESPRMRFAPGLSLAYDKPVPKGLGVAIDGNVAGVMLDEGSLGSYDFFLHMPSTLPYLLSKPGRVVVIGNKGGVDALMPYYFGARQVVWTEKDRSVERLIHTRYGTKGPYGETFRYEDARSFIRGVRATDLIVVSRTAFSPSGAFGLQEDYDTTVEALRTYLSALASDGLLYIQLFILPPPRYELRTANNLAHALAATGVKRLEPHLVIFRSWDTMNFLVKKSGFTDVDRAVIDRFLKTMEFAQVFPRVHGPSSITGFDYGEIFQKVLNEGTRPAFEESYPFDIRATSDDRPFFHYFLKLGRVGEAYRLAGNKWSYFVYEGMALPFLVGLLIILGLLLFAGAFFCSSVRRRAPGELSRRSGRPLRQTARFAFFAVIGAGFMFVEAFFIHSLILPFGSPVRSFAFTIVALLFGSGAGSLASGRLRQKHLAVTMVSAPVLLFLCGVLLPLLRESPFLIVFAVLSGLSLGTFFPSGIRFLCGSDRMAIPLAYAANGTTSIIAPPLASVAAAGLGLTALIMVSAAIYLAASLALAPIVWANRRGQGIR